MTPTGSSTARNRAAAQTVGRLSLAYFSLAKQRKVSSRRATPGLLAKGTCLANRKLVGATPGFGRDMNSDTGFGLDAMDLWSFRAVAPFLRSLIAIEFEAFTLAGVDFPSPRGQREPGSSSLAFREARNIHWLTGTKPRQQPPKQFHPPSYQNSYSPTPLPC